MGKNRKLSGPKFKIRRVRMLTECQVGEILSRHHRGEGKRTIAKAMGISERTVKRYCQFSHEQAQQAMSKQTVHRVSQLDAHYDRIVQVFWDTDGNCPNMLEVLESEGITCSLRTLQWFCKRHDLRRQQKNLLNSQRHPKRIETLPGEELQIDFGEKEVLVNGIYHRVHFFVATLGYSRSIYAQFFTVENKEAWYSGLESSFIFFGGIPRKVVCDNAKALVYQAAHYKFSPRYNDSFIGLCKYWGIIPQACTPNTPQQKGKVERSVLYIQENFLKDFRNFKSIQDIQEQFVIWSKGISNKRKMKTADGIPFTPEGRLAAEIEAMQPIHKSRIAEYKLEDRKVNDNCIIIIEYKRYLLPDELRNCIVQVQIGDNDIVVSYNGKTYTRIDKSDYQKPIFRPITEKVATPKIGIEFPAGALDRPLSDYDEAAS